VPFNGGCGLTQRRWLKKELADASAAGEKVVVSGAKEMRKKRRYNLLYGKKKKRNREWKRKRQNPIFLVHSRVKFNRGLHFGALWCMAWLQVCSHVPILAEAASERTILYDADQVLRVLHGKDEEEAEEDQQDIASKSGKYGGAEVKKGTQEARDKTGSSTPPPPSSSSSSSSSCVVAVFAGHMHRGGCVNLHIIMLRAHLCDSLNTTACSCFGVCGLHPFRAVFFSAFERTTIFVQAHFPPHISHYSVCLFAAFLLPFVEFLPVHYFYYSAHLVPSYLHFALFDSSVSLVRVTSQQQLRY
jgi:hypothetical protein